MNHKVQNIFLWMYKKVEQKGVLESKIGQSIFYEAYTLYKLFFEAGPIQQLKSFISAESVVIDVGANIGFFSTRFAKWAIPAGGKVIALEPENKNFQQLVKVLQSQGYPKNTVETLNCAVAEKCGLMYLAINPYHPGDHRLEADGIPVNVVTIDKLLSERGWPRVSLIKIDVQGAELRVILGARKCLEKFKPALFIEVDDRNLKSNGGSASELIDTLGELGYKPFCLSKKGLPLKISTDEILSLVSQDHYADILFY